jgi:hypothetical protein
MVVSRRSPQKNRRWRPAADLVMAELLSLQQAPVRRAGKVIPGRPIGKQVAARIHCPNPNKTSRPPSRRTRTRFYPPRDGWRFGLRRHVAAFPSPPIAPISPRNLHAHHHNVGGSAPPRDTSPLFLHHSTHSISASELLPFRSLLPQLAPVKIPPVCSLVVFVVGYSNPSIVLLTKDGERQRVPTLLKSARLTAFQTLPTLWTAVTRHRFSFTVAETGLTARRTSCNDVSPPRPFCGFASFETGSTSPLFLHLR